MRKTLETAINGLKLWTERLVKRSADEVRGEIPAIPTPKQADWNQNDDTEIDHIKGRTHYERIGFKQIPIGTYNDHAPGYTDYNVGPYAWDYTNGITLRVDGVVYEFETFTKSDFDSNLGCYGYWVGAPFVRGQIADSSEYPFHFRIFEKDNEYAHVEFADGTDNHTFEVFCTETKQLDEKYIPESIARKSDIPQGGGSADIPSTLPNPHPLTFTGAVEATYDGSTPVEVEIPMGGGGADETWELINDYTVENNVNFIIVNKDSDGKAFALKKILIFVDMVLNRTDDKTIGAYDDINGTAEINGNKVFPGSTVFAVGSPSRTVRYYGELAAGYFHGYRREVVNSGTAPRIFDMSTYTPYIPDGINEFGLFPSLWGTVQISTGTKIKIYGVRM